jgi:hypothetical protein
MSLCQDYVPADLSRKDPRHPLWRDAAFIYLDASFMALVSKDAGLLIYSEYSGDPSKNIHLPAHHFDKLVHLRLQQK